MSSVEDTKVDITSLDIQDGNRELSLLCLNFSIPHHKQENPAQFQALVSDISEFLALHFLPDNRVTFQVTASYYLKNRNTEEERLWTGSFFPGNRVSLSGLYFQIFNSQNFFQKLVGYTAQANVLGSLSWTHLTTEWYFLSIASFIVNCQVTVNYNHEFLRTFNLHSSRRRRQRRHVTLVHPW